MNAILDEKREAQWPLPPAVFPGFDKLRLQPTVGAILDDLKADDDGRGDLLIHGSLKYVLIMHIIAGNLRRVHATLGKLLGIDTPDGKSLPIREVEDRKPPAKAAR